MEKHLILSVLSDDKPGVVKGIAQLVAEHHGSWQESRLTQLAGKFAGVVRITVEADREAALTAALAELETQGIRVLVEDIPVQNRQQTSRSARFSLAGPDRPGIVFEITQAFIQYQINVDDMNTHCSSMPYSGEPLFEADGILSLPSDMELDRLQEQLEHIADSLALDIQLEELTAAR